MAETGLNALMKKVLRFLIVLVCCVAGFQIAFLVMRTHPDWMPALLHPNVWIAICILISAVVGFIITPVIWWVLKKIGTLFENMLQNVSSQDISVTLLGLIVSLMLANLLAIPFRELPTIGFYIAIALNIIFAFVGMRLAVRKKEAIWRRLTAVWVLGSRRASRRGRRSDDEQRSGAEGERAPAPTSDAMPKVLDTSALIDGRILDVAKTGFLEGTFVLPRFVLAELQGVADSSDPTRRARGRKGLQVVAELQKSEGISVRIEDVHIREMEREDVDSALVVLSKRLGAKLITSDYNLNQVSRIEGVCVLNVNELANALKPQFMPGDMTKIYVIRAGKERGQGVGYLDDGTMLVVEDGEPLIGQTVDILITSMLQTPAGRMVFGKVKR